LAKGILSYGVYIPRFRIRLEEIARVWGDGEEISEGLRVLEKSVPDLDEDAVTIAVEAARNAIDRCGADPKRIGAIYAGSESHPYAVKPTATIVGQAVCSSSSFTAADFEFACKAGTAAVQACLGLVGSGIIDLGLAIGADVSQGAPGDMLEYTAAAGGAAYLIGSQDLAAEIEDTYSFTTDTPDFWRREGMPYPEHGGRFTGEPAYFKHVFTAAQTLMYENGLKAADYTYAVFHQPNTKFPQRVAKQLGFTQKQIEPGLLSPMIGNTYAASSPLGLTAVLDIAKPGDRILMVSYGSGAGSDALDIRVTDKISEGQMLAQSTQDYIHRSVEIDYAMYDRYSEKLMLK